MPPTRADKLDLSPKRRQPFAHHVCVGRVVEGGLGCYVAGAEIMGYCDDIKNGKAEIPPAKLSALLDYLDAAVTSPLADVGGAKTKPKRRSGRKR